MPPDTKRRVRTLEVCLVCETVVCSPRTTTVRATFCHEIPARPRKDRPKTCIPRMRFEDNRDSDPCCRLCGKMDLQPCCPRAPRSAEVVLRLSRSTSMLVTPGRRSPTFVRAKRPGICDKASWSHCDQPAQCRWQVSAATCLWSLPRTRWRRWLAFLRGMRQRKPPVQISNHDYREPCTGGGDN